MQSSQPQTSAQESALTSAQPSAIGFGLSSAVRVLLFDLDGVITQTAVVHAAAWKETFDELLLRHPLPDGSLQPEFDRANDYDRFVDGRPRYDGVRTFLASRNISLPEGTPEEAPGFSSVCAVGNTKNQLVEALIARDGVEAYPGSVAYLDAIAGSGLRSAVVSSSANCRAILASCGLLDRFEFVMDGVVAADRGIAGKPAPDTFLAAAQELGADASECAVFEDALAGVAAGRAGGFAEVIGVDRVGQREALIEHGADLVVLDLAELIGQQ